MKQSLSILLLSLPGLVGCSNEQIDFELKGTWVDTGSPALQFIEFNSPSQGRFGFLSKNDEQYKTFTYRVSDEQIGIDIIGDNAGERLHEFKFISGNELEITGLTDLPGDPTKTLKKSNIKRELENSEVVLGIDDIYFDKESSLRLQGRCTSDSRCPPGAACLVAGNTEASFNLVIDGVDQYEFDLFGPGMYDFLPRRDTLIQGFRYGLLDVQPCPQSNGERKLEDYRLKVSIVKD